MTQKFETREEAAKFMIDNPGVVLVDGVGDKVRWNCGGFEVLSSLNKWEYVCYLDPTPFTLPEPEKEELPELGSALREVLRTQCCASCTEHFFRVLLAEAEARAKRIADERIEAASIVWRDSGVIDRSYKLKRGES